MSYDYSRDAQPYKRIGKRRRLKYRQGETEKT
jgi:hypothetical protein